MHVPDIFGNQLYKMFASPIVRQPSDDSQAGQSTIDKTTPNLGKQRNSTSSKIGSRDESQ